MGQALTRYVYQKIPAQEMLKTIDAVDSNIEVHGLYPKYAQSFLQHKGYNLQEITFKAPQSEKNINFVRPKFFVGTDAADQPVVICAVTPGQNYVNHYASFLRFFLDTSNLTEKELHVVQHPMLEKNVSLWSNLDEQFVHENDRVILGYTEDVVKAFKKIPMFAHVQHTENDFYASDRFKTSDGEILNAIGVKYSFWGNMSAEIANNILNIGAKEILYFSKIGSIKQPEDIYKTVFCPNRYLIANKETVTVEPFEQSNAIIPYVANNLHTGTHVSIPTVLEETHKQREIVTKKGADSIDNESAQIAYVFHKKDLKDRIYTAIHFATDYLYGQRETFNHGQLNLANARSKEAIAKKTSIKKAIVRSICDYVTTPCYTIQ